MAASASNSKGIPSSRAIDAMLTAPAIVPSDDESTIKVAPTKKEPKDKPNGTIKLKKPAPKHNKPGNWRDGSVIDGTPAWEVWCNDELS
jgi:hypothetical protein